MKNQILTIIGPALLVKIMYKRNKDTRVKRRFVDIPKHGYTVRWYSIIPGRCSVILNKSKNGDWSDDTRKNGGWSDDTYTRKNGGLGHLGHFHLAEATIRRYTENEKFCFRGSFCASRRCQYIHLVLEVLLVWVEFQGKGYHSSHLRTNAGINK